MTLKIAAALLAFALAVSPVLGQIADRLPVGYVADRPPTEYPVTQAPVAQAPGGYAPAPPPVDPDPGEINQPPQLYPMSTTPVYTPAWTERWSVDASYLMGFVRPVHVPALVTTSPSGTPQAQAGVLGPNTSVLFGDRDFDGDMRSGFRLGFGGWFDDNRTLGFNVGCFWLTGLDQTFSANSNGSMILARPFTNANTGAPASLLVAFPSATGPNGAASSGSINVSANSQQFYGAHFDLQESLFNDPGFRLKSLLGYRYLHFSDGLQISETMNPTGGSPAPPPGTQIFSQDSFAASNTFNGGEVGFQAEWIRGPFAASLLAKAAIGSIHRGINIAGSTLITAPGNAPISSSGGLLALPSNSGDYSSNVFTIIPEVGLTFSYDVTANLRLTAGYSLLVLYDAVRAADQIDTTVNPSLLNSSLVTPSSAGSSQRPMFSLQESNVWVQTINVGLEFRY